MWRLENNQQLQVTEQGDELICLKDNHNEPIIMVILNHAGPLQDMILCGKCFRINRPINKEIISIDEAKDMIAKKLISEQPKIYECKMKSLKNLLNFQEQLRSLQMIINSQFEEMFKVSGQSINQIQMERSYNEKTSLLYTIELLHKDYSKLNSIAQISQQVLDKFNVMNDIIKSSIEDCFINCYQILKNNLKLFDQEKLTKKNPQIQKEQGVEQQYDFAKFLNNLLEINQVQQCCECRAITFNNDGSIMAASAKERINVWKFDGQELVKQSSLKEHSKTVLCLVFSKQENWFASGGSDQIIIGWLQQRNRGWQSKISQHEHKDWVLCLLLNKNELISCSCDKSIKVWKVNCGKNCINYDYTLCQRHSETIYCISLNESETSLVSCSHDKNIILWGIGAQKRWVYKNHIETTDEGFRICFINNYDFIWQEKEQGITHFFQIQDGKIIQKDKKNLQLMLNQGDDMLFPTIMNNPKEIVIQKHNQFVYILKYSDDKLKLIAQPIDCKSNQNYGALTNDGQYLVIWCSQTEQFHIYNLKFE